MHACATYKPLEWVVGFWHLKHVYISQSGVKKVINIRNTFNWTREAYPQQRLLSSAYISEAVSNPSNQEFLLKCKCIYNIESRLNVVS